MLYIHSTLEKVSVKKKLKARNYNDSHAHDEGM